MTYSNNVFTEGRLTEAQRHALTTRDKVEVFATCLLGAATLALLAYAVFGR